MFSSVRHHHTGADRRPRLAELTDDPWVLSCADYILVLSPHRTRGASQLHSSVPGSRAHISCPCLHSVSVSRSVFVLRAG